MPDLNGHPFKPTLYRKVRELTEELSDERAAHRKTRDALQIANLRNEISNEKIARIEKKLQETFAEVSMGLDQVFREKHERNVSARRARKAAQGDSIIATQ
jgi:hypothetical protein